MFSYAEFILRHAVHEDAQGLFGICTDPEVMKYYGDPGFCPESVKNAVSEIDWFNELFKRNAGRWIICKKDDDAYLGDIGFFNYSAAHKRAELGYKLKKEYWGKGIISNFIKALSAYGFDELKYNRIEALTDARNIASKKVLAKNGFKLEGTLREYEYDDGGFIDMEMYSLLERDYRRV